MNRDANQIAREWERQQRSKQDPVNFPIRGTLTIWASIEATAVGWLTQSNDVVITLKDSGAIVAYDLEGDAEIFYPVPGWYVNFVPNHEGE